jgi:hypothetical protein
LHKTETEVETETDSVPKGTATDEKWNVRLAPLARALGGDAHVGNWLKYLKPICEAGATDDMESVLWGVRWLADKGALEETHGIRKGDLVKPAVLRSPRADILKREAIAAYHRHGPNEGTALVAGLTQIGGMT